MTRRRWIADVWNENTAALTGDQASHLARVLRAEPGMECDVVAGGRVWHAAVASATEQEVRFNLIDELETETALPVTLLLSIFKFDSMEWAIEKATELGVEAIVPMIARRTEKHLALAAAKRVDRWRRIVKEAAQQSRRSDTPEVREVMPLKSALAQRQSNSENKSVAVEERVVRIVLSEQEQSVTLKDAVQDSLGSGGSRGADRASGLRFEVAIGPVGGWAPEEIALFNAEGWRPVTLGPRILRAETAAITALAVIAAWLG